MTSLRTTSCLSSYTKLQCRSNAGAEIQFALFRDFKDNLNGSHPEPIALRRYNNLHNVRFDRLQATLAKFTIKA